MNNFGYKFGRSRHELSGSVICGEGEEGSILLSMPKNTTPYNTNLYYYSIQLVGILYPTKVEPAPPPQSNTGKKDEKVYCGVAFLLT